MKRMFAKSLLAASLTLLPGIASAEIIDLGSSGRDQVRIMRGAPDRCGISGPIVISLHDGGNQRPVRCAVTASDSRIEQNGGININNLVVVFLADGQKRHYKRHH